VTTIPKKKKKQQQKQSKKKKKWVTRSVLESLVIATEVHCHRCYRSVVALAERHLKALAVAVMHLE
jgi:hypothetical protein